MAPWHEEPELAPMSKLKERTKSNKQGSHRSTVWAPAAAESLSRVRPVRPHRRQPARLPRPGILQARTLEWVAIAFSSAWEWKLKVKPLSRVRLLATPWTAAHQAPLPMGFSRQEYWSGLPLPSPTAWAKKPQMMQQWELPGKNRSSLKEKTDSTWCPNE